MASEKDIFEKMDALVRKHHPTPAQPVTDAASPVKPASANIPTLTDIIPDPSLDSELEQDLIPLLTESIQVPQALATESGLELDLDPYFTITAPEPLQSPALEVIEKFVPPEASAQADAIAFPKLEEPLFTEIVELNATPPAAPVTEVQQDTIPAAPLLSAEALTQFSDALSEQLMRALDQRLQQAVDKKIAPQLAQTVDKALSSMLDQFSVNIEDMVRESIAQELQRQLTALLNNSDNNKSS